MIIKTKIGKTFGGCVNYLIGKEQSEILLVEGVRLNSPKDMINDFNYIRKLNPNLGNAVWHTSIAFAYEDKVTPELMKDVALDYVSKFGLEQYAVIIHNDTQHKHFHIIANRVKYNSETISDKFCAGKGVELSKKLETKYNLSSTVKKGKNIQETNKQALKGANKVKYEIYEAINKEIQSCKSIDELRKNLKTQAINVNLNAHDSGIIYGVSFQKSNQKFKGSEIDKQFSFKKLMKRIELNVELKPIINTPIDYNNVFKISVHSGNIEDIEQAMLKGADIRMLKSEDIAMHSKEKREEIIKTHKNTSLRLFIRNGNIDKVKQIIINGADFYALKQEDFDSLTQFQKEQIKEALKDGIEQYKKNNPNINDQRQNRGMKM